MMKGTNQPDELAAKRDPASVNRGFVFNNAGSQTAMIQQDKADHDAKSKQMESAAGRYKSFRQKRPI